MIKDAHTFSGYSIIDRKATLKFYRDTLGLPVTETPEGLRMELQGTTVFMYPKPDHVPATFTVLNFVVPNIDEGVEELVGKGITFDRYDVGQMIADEKNIYRGLAAGHGPDIAWFKDPSGNVLSVIQDKAS